MSLTTTEQLLTVTPAQAQAWLATTDPVPADPQVDLLAAAMTAGHYQPNPLDPVRLDLTGRLRGGTRRLAALCQLGQPMPLWVDLCPPVQPHERQPARFVMNKRLTGGGPGLRAQAMRFDGTNAQAVHAWLARTVTQDTADVQAHVRADGALMLRLIDRAGKHWDYHVAYPGDWVIYLQWADDTMLNLPHARFVQLFDHEERTTAISKITYVFGDATDPQGDDHKIIVHVCNDIGLWGKGFVLSVSKRWPDPEQEYRALARSGSPDFTLGHVQIVDVDADIHVANMVAQRSVGDGDHDGPPIRYDAVRQCLGKVAAWATSDATVARYGPVSVHMPRIGCGLAGGEWDDIEPIIEAELCAKGVQVTVYDLRD